MLVHNSVLFMDELGDLTIKQVKDICYREFAICLKEELLENYPEPHKAGLQNYDFFTKEYGKLVTLNNKNITYEETFTDLKDFCGEFFHLRCHELSDGSKKWIPYTREELNKQVKQYYEETGCHSEFVDDKTFELYAGFTKFFGEFPFMKITFVRLGNQDYYYATIVR